MINPKTMKKWVVSSTVAGMVLAAPITGHAALGDQTLRQGMDHSDVKELQEVLRDKGYFTYPTSTGYYGSITRAAVIAFQRDAHLAVDGITGPQTLKALQTNGSSSSKGKTNSIVKEEGFNTDQVLRRGTRGQAVTSVQHELQAAGYYTYTVDGSYGPLTEKAVRQFQQKAGLVVDGIAGPKTLSALFGSSSQPGASAPETPDASQSDSDSASEQSKAPVLRVGSRGQAVTDLQNKLEEIGVFPYKVDGIFGQQTASAVRQFQLQSGLSVDGIVGPATRAKLQNASGSTGDQQEANEKLNVIQLVADAGALMGTPYQWGGTTPSGFDCSGFLVHVFGKQGVHLPRTVAQMWNVGKKVSEPSVGDVVFFETYKDGPSHNGIYVGNDQFIHSGTSTGVTISNLKTNSYWSTRYLGARQLY